MHPSLVAPRHASVPPTVRPIPTAAPSLPLGALLAAAAILALPTSAHAQHGEIGAFTSWYPSLDAGGSGGNLPLWGVSVGGGGTGLGVRASGAVRTSVARSDAAYGTGTTPTWGSAGWVADVDVIYDTRNNPLLRPLSSALFGFSPAVFTGVGGMGRRDADGAMRTVPVFSYGGGVSRTLAGNLALSTEARRRAPSRGTNAALPSGIRPGWEYRAGLSLRFGRAGGGSSGGGLPRLPVPRPGGAGSGTMGTASGAAVVDTGDDYLGVRYVYGGTTPRGFDCSGFVQFVFDRNGVRLPRTSRQQAQVGRDLPTSVAALRPGDLIFFNTEGARIDHVAMYAGGNRIIHSSSSGGGVRYDDLGSKRGRWFVSKMVAARRVTDGRGNSLVDGATLTRLLGEVVRSFDQPDKAPRP